jgi:hypothetical protein
MNQNTPKPGPDVESVRRSVKGASSVAPSSYRDAANAARSEKIELDGREQFFSLRGTWSKWLIFWISAILLFQGSLTVAVGLGHLDFLEYKWFLPMVIGQSFLQIIGMGVVIVKFLYK